MDATKAHPVTNNISFTKIISLINNDLKESRGMMMRVPEWKLDVYASGSKNIQGFLTNIDTLLLFNPVNEAWIEITFNGNYPSRIKTKAGIIAELSNYNRASLTFDEYVFDSVNNKVINPKTQIKLPQTVFDNFDNVAAALSQNEGAKLMDIEGSTYKSDCQKAKDLASNISAAASVVGCLLGLIEIVASDGTTIFLDPLNALSTFSSCYQAYIALTGGNSFSCSEQGALDGLGITTGCTGGGNLVTFAVNCGSNILGSAGDLKSCAPCNDPPPTPARSTGDPHLTTMDGLKYNFQGYGEFVAVKSTTDNFEVQARQVDVYNTNRVTLNTAVAVRTGSDVICALVNPLRLYLNNIKLPSDFGTITLTDGSTLFRDATDIKLSTVQGDVILIRWLNTGWLLDYMITLGDSRKGKVAGIFGNFDGNSQNDLMLSNGTPISADSLFPKFADSWRITQASSLFFYDSARTTESYTDRNFPKVVVNITPQQESWAKTVCSNAGVKNEPYYSECVYDVAVTNSPALVNSSLWAQAYFDQTTTISPVGADVNYFKGVRLEVSTDQTDTTQLNLISWKTGNVYSLKNGFANAANIDAVAAITCGISLFTPAALKSCGGSCGVSSINSIIDNQDWGTVLQGNLDHKYFVANDDPSQNKNNPSYIPVSNWDAIYSAANIDSIYLQEPLNPSANDATVYCEIAASDNTCNLENGTPLNNSVFRFITQDGKKGFFIVSGFGKIDGTNKFWITLDIKIEK